MYVSSLLRSYRGNSVFLTFPTIFHFISWACFFQFPARYSVFSVAEHAMQSVLITLSYYKTQGTRFLSYFFIWEGEEERCGVKAVKKIGRIWGKRYKKSFIAFEHTLCLTKNLPFCLEYIYFIYICSIFCFCFRFLFILGDVGGRGVHRSPI